MGWKDTLDEAIMAADLSRARRPLKAGRYDVMRLTRSLDAAARTMQVELPARESAPQLVGVDDPVAATLELLQRAALGGRAQGLSREAVKTLYWRLAEGKRPAKAARWPTLKALGAVLLAAGAATAIALLVAGGSSVQVEGPATTSGRLSAEDEVDWVGTLSSWAVALDALSATRSEGSTNREARERTDRVSGLRKKATQARPGTDLGSEVTAALDAFMKAAEHASRPGGSPKAEDALIAVALRRVNAALREAKRPYYIDHATFTYSADRIQVTPFVFHIEDTRRFRTPSGAAAIAHVVRRLDTLSMRQALLGYTKQNMDVALVRADSIERTAKERLAPALVDGGPVALPVPRGADADAWAALLATGGAAVRAAMAGRTLDLNSLGARYAVAVMGHEAQHRVDYDGLGLPIPQIVRGLSGGDAAAAEHTARELSAYTAELVHDPVWAKLGIINLLGHVVDGSESAEAISAALILSGLDAGLGHNGAALRAGEGVDVARAIEAARNILAVSDSAIATAAAELWAGWFGRPFAPLTAE